jgi:hypothetical protein
MTTLKLSLFLASGLALSGCAPPPDEAIDDPTEEIGNGKEDAIGADEDPSILVRTASRRLSTNLPKADVGKTFTVDGAHMPYSDTFWPYSDPTGKEGTGKLDNGIDATFGEPDSPLAKFMKLTNAGKLADAQAWEKSNHGSGVSGVDTWFGHCNGWTAAALKNPLPKKAVSAKLSGTSVVSCAAGSAGCVTFQIADLTALLAEIYLDAPADFLGARCDTAPGAIKRDAAGRILTAGCEGTNPASVLIVANALIKKKHMGFAIDAQRPDNTDEIWNQPAYAYTIVSAEPLTEQQAAQLVLKKDDYASINADAKGWVKATMRVDWGSEPLSGRPDPKPATESSDSHTFTVVLELDAAVTDLGTPGKANLIGGEYLDDPNQDANRLSVFPFLWAPKGAGPESPGGDGHNPFVKVSLVKKLVALAK